MHEYRYKKPLVQINPCGCRTLPSAASHLGVIDPYFSSWARVTVSSSSAPPFDWDFLCQPLPDPPPDPSAQTHFAPRRNHASAPRFPGSHVEFRQG